MANELVQAVESSPFNLDALNQTFATVANANSKRRELEIRERESAQNAVLKAAGLDLREQALALKTNQSAVAAQGQDLLNQIRMQKLQEAQVALQQAREYSDAVAAATVDGKPLAVRLKSDDPTEAEAAYKNFAEIRDKFRGSVSPIVNQDIKSMEALPYVQGKQRLAEDKEKARAAEAERKAGQTDRGLDIRENVLGETERHNGAMEEVAGRNAGTAEKRADTGAAAQEDTARHRQVQEGISQQNANTRSANSANRATGAKNAGPGLSGMSLPNVGFVSMSKIRRVLARGIAKDASPSEVSDAEVLQKAILAIPSGNRDTDTGANIPRFKSTDIGRWAMEGETELEPGAKPGVVEPPLPKAAAPAAPTPVPNAPAETPELAPVPGAPADQPPQQAPASGADAILRKYKIPARPKTSSTNAAGGGGIMGATQGYLASLGITPPPAPQSIGFGGFGLPAA